MSKTDSDVSASNLLTGTLHGRPRAILRSIVLALLRPLLSLRLIGVETVPQEGPLLVASNHLSNADPIILEAAFPRPLFFLGKAELFRNPIFRWMLRRFGGIPVERGTADRAAIRRARAVLEQGIALGIYPEGVRSKTAALVKGLPGAGLIALQSDSPVLPVAIYGTEFFPVNGEVPPRRPKELPRGVTVHFGLPIHIPERVDGKRVTADEATHLIMVRIAELLPERYHGVYARDGLEEETMLAEREGS
ncbi:MAG: phospholipid/glycerol acyltransferase [Thermomicrobiales bacterium]|nr:phospholipid/glycerol acyltransferase [Thermomicrobiales bacterium]MCD6058399.1 phospholipid/glycerol acyltransferase [Thermomicrobiales bacterium]MDF3016184.1 phospholipid/glycerol acyltransferase [Thermomicrobiales bacterium]